MARSNYKIAYVERGKDRLWRQFWVNGNNGEEVSAAHRAGYLGRTEHLVAASLEAAIAEVQRRHPGCTIMREGSGRLSGA